nr:coiled-coil domain-containing protein CG32809 isoform X3 [Ciona intestinalis]|eukprot:XP_026691609.1 coiled-coil domain-containing protein CG32809 isoform X3 [Ciona intestinalis]
MDFDTTSVSSTSSMTSETVDSQVKYSSLQRNYQHGHKSFQFNTLDGRRTRSKSGGHHNRSFYPQDGSISPAEADRKRSAFFQYLVQKYPQHSDVIVGKSFQQTQTPAPSFGGIRTRASYAADCSYNSSSPNDSEVTWHNSLSRGSRLRSSLPIVRSLSRSRERPLGTIYLEYSGECRTARLPNEVTSLDTIRALFVQAYPGLLTMPMLDPQRHSILLKNRKTGNYDEIDNVSRIKDRSFIRTRPIGGSGIPLPGTKKPTINHPKPAAKPVKPIPGNNRSKPRVTDDVKIAERNQKNLNKSGIKAPVKSLIRQYQSAPSLIKQAVTGSNEIKPVQSGEETQGKVKPPPPPRSAKPTVVAQTEAAQDQGNYSPNGTLLSGNGIGGGSIPQKTFSYVKSGNESPVNHQQQTITSPPQHRGLRQPTTSRLSPPSVEKKFSSIPTPGSKPKIQLPPNPTKPTDDEHHTKENVPRPKTPNILHQSPPTVTKLPPTSFAMTSPKNGAQRLPQPKPFGMKQHTTPANRFGAKRTSPPNVPNNNQLVPETAPVYSNIKRSASPERRATINGTGGSAGYCRGGRSFKGHQLKPVNIPSVPDTEIAAASNLEAKPDLNVPEVAQPVEPRQPISLPSDTKYSAMLPNPCTTDQVTSCSSSTSSDDVTDPGKSKMSTKKGLFGLRRLVSNRNKNPQNIPKRSQSEERPKTSDPSVNKSDLHSPSFNESLASFRSSSPALQVSTPVVRSSPIMSKSPAIPKSDLLNSLLTTNKETPEPNTDVMSTSSSDDDKDKPAPHPILAGVLKNNNLVKSTSSSSILSDSGASNVSMTSSIRTKKVSFQDDVTVCDGNGISTFSNGLREPDASVADVSFDRSMEQSLSVDTHEGAENEPKQWRPPSNGPPARNDFQQVGYRARPATPHRYEPPPYQPSPLAYQTNSPRSHQSAVAAAIQSISGNAETTSSAARYIPSQPEHFSVSCASPVPVVTRQGHEAPHKEEWNPLRRQSADASSNSPSITQRTCPTPVPTAPHKLAEVQVENEPSYFQTERAPSRSETFNSDTPPYYECCETTTPASGSITPSQLRDALKTQDEQYQHPVVESAGPENQSSVTFSSLPLSVPPSGNVLPQPETDVTNKKVMAMERQLASLTGMVESIITSTDGVQTNKPEPPYQNQPVGGNLPKTSHTVQQVMTSSEMGQQLLKLRETAHNLRDQMTDLKRQQRINMEHVNDIVSEKSRELAQFIAVTAGAQHRPLRIRRFRLDQQRHAYSEDATTTERMLSEVEAAVEELRNEVVERRCRVNAREVEALVLQLSQAGRTVAKLKGSYPALCEEIRTVGAGETEVIYAEEKFVEAEPTRLDEQLKRCRQLTATLFTLKKLATVQEARSKTPTSFGAIRPNTPSQLGARRGEDPNASRGRMLEEVRRTRVDPVRRMESIRDAEVSWIRRRKYNSEYDSKKFEKALELAEKALNRTNHLSLIDQRRHNHLMDLYKNRDVMNHTPRSNLTTSDSSSIESLPPPPPPMDHMGHQFHPNQQPSYPLHLPPPPADLNLPGPPPHEYSVISPDIGYMSSDLSPEHRGQTQTGSLPRYSNATRFHGYQQLERSHGTSHPAYVDYHNHGRQTPQMVERSRSVTPHHWNQRPITPQMFTSEIPVGRELTEDQRRHILEQQHLMNEEKNCKLKEQYSKLQQLQRKQRMASKKYVPKPNYQSMSMAASAKSSDV